MIDIIDIIEGSGVDHAGPTINPGYYSSSLMKPRTSVLACQLPISDPVGLIGFFPQALLAIRFVLAVVPLKPDHLAIALKRENVGGQTVEEPAVVTADHGAAGEIF